MSREGPNRAPISTDTFSLNWFIHQEQDLIAAFQNLETASKKERVRMADKCVTLQRTFTSTQALRDAASKMQSDNNSFITRLTAELTAQESDIATLSECLPSTLAFLKGWETVKNVAISLQTALEEQLGPIGHHLTAVEEELEMTNDLSGHMSHSIGVFSSAIGSVQKSIVARTKGFLHPIRRLPAEILQLIFEECVDSEAAEWFEDPSQPPKILKSATRIVGTCRSWRTIAQQTPRTWNRLRAPIRVYFRNSKRISYRTVGLGAFQESLRLCGDIPLELTIYDTSSLPEEPNVMSLEIDRLNIFDTSIFEWRPDHWSASFPSPRHLWVGRGGSPGSNTRELPSSLISRTTAITAHNITVAIQKQSYSVTQLVLYGVQKSFRLTSVLASLPCLNELDAGNAPVESQCDQHQALVHKGLRHLRIHISCLRALEYCLANGLQLPGLSCLGLAGQSKYINPLHYIPSSFPSASAQLPTTVTHLEVHGEHTITTSSIGTLIDTFDRIDTISTHGNAVGTILDALCQICGMLEDEKPTVEERLPSRIQALYIRDYRGDGEDLYPALRQISTSIEPIKVSFENCPNILPKIRGDREIQTTAS